MIVLGKVARHSFPMSEVIPGEAHAGDFFYLIGLATGILLWAFALVWFVVAIIMIATAFSFPFNMGWWGFVFPTGEFKPSTLIICFTRLIAAPGIFTLLTISIGEEFDFKFFRVLSCVSNSSRVVRVETPLITMPRSWQVYAS
jgi:hypothetical protein